MNGLGDVTREIPPLGAGGRGLFSAPPHTQKWSDPLTSLNSVYEEREGR